MRAHFLPRGEDMSRKKDPQQVRSRLLESASRLAADNGLAEISLSAVAAAAGVTKGGLFHHFPNKRALISALFTALIADIDREIDDYLQQDAGGYGCFTRAYVRSGFAESDDRVTWAAITYSIKSDSELIELWDAWIAGRLARHQATDSAPALEIVRLAADGAWFQRQLSRRPESAASRELEQRLLHLTYPQDGAAA